MADTALHELLTRVHEELEGCDRVDPQIEADLKQVLADISRVAGEGSSSQHETTVLTRDLQETAARLDSSGFPLGRLLGEVVEFLNKTGI